MLMLSMESTDTLPTDHMPIVPTDHMLTPPDGDMERDLLMLKPRLTQLSSTPVLSQLLLLPMLVSTLSTPQLSTQLDPQSTMEREAEAVPAVHSVVGTHAVVGSPLVHHTYAVPTVAKTVVPAVTVAKAADHGVVGTYAGLVHSSH